MDIPEGIRRTILAVGAVGTALLMLGAVVSTPAQPNYDEWTSAIKAAAQRDTDPQVNPRWKLEWSPADQGKVFVESSCQAPQAASHVKSICVAYSAEKQTRPERVAAHFAVALAQACAILLGSFLLSRLSGWVLSGFARQTPETEPKSGPSA